jgi:Tol biopolymer transport system component
MRAAIAVLALLAALAFAATAHASLVYESATSAHAVYIADDDGANARKLVAGGSVPHLSADGQTVIYTAGSDGSNPQLREIPAAGGASRTLATRVRFGTFAWSPDGRYVAVETGPLNGRHQLTLVDRTTGAKTTIASGYLQGASFSPASDRLVYALATSFSLFAATNLHVVPVTGGSAAAITTDGRATFPVWGPQTIAFSHWQRPPRHNDDRKLNLATINPDGTGQRLLTHDKVPFLLTGLIPVDWSADGTRLLAQFGGRDTGYIVTVDPGSGAEHVVGSKRMGYSADALSADGSTILATNGGPVFGTRLAVLTVPYAGGGFTTVARGQSPDWNL